MKVKRTFQQIWSHFFTVIAWMKNWIAMRSSLHQVNSNRREFDFVGNTHTEAQLYIWAEMCISVNFISPLCSCNHLEMLWEVVIKNDQVTDALNLTNSCNVNVFKETYIWRSVWQIYVWLELIRPSNNSALWRCASNYLILYQLRWNITCFRGNNQIPIFQIWRGEIGSNCREKN